ncbi:metallophosphoesterase [Sphingomonas sp.]|uniref:metallophosphoesterase n=1 Tax=Sphingomonas sp. TaxID=28214 RepID=UPI00333F25BD
MGLFRKTPKPAPPPSGPPGARVYAIGDVHGRLDLLRDLLEQIDADSQARPCAREFVVFLGDLIDRGPESRGVLQLLQSIRANLPNPVFVMGNHEEMLLRVLGDDPERVWDWMSFGGYEFAQSYGVEVGRLATLSASAAAAEIRAAMPPSDLSFVESFIDSFRFGDYLFVHAGIRPGTPLEQQKIADLRWIREGFLDSTAVHPFVVVHGHTITDGPDEQPNRIGIDTGAYATGVLTAVCLEGTARKYLTAVR